MISDRELAAIGARAATATGTRWESTTTEDGTPAVSVVLEDGCSQRLTVTRETQPASNDAMDFIAHARSDVERLIAVLRGEASLPDEALEEIETRCAHAGRAPWKVFLESDGGMGGSSVIWVSDEDDEPDLYLWLDGHPASDADFEFVASARQDLPGLLNAARGSDA